MDTSQVLVQRLQTQLGLLMFELCVRDARIESLLAEIAKLKETANGE